MKYLTSHQVYAGILSAAVLASATAHAATDFTDADATDSLINNPLNWSNGLPNNVDPNDGTITIDVDVDTDFTIENYGNVTHSDGLINRVDSLGGLPIGDGTNWLMSGTATAAGLRGITVSTGGTFTLDLASDSNIANFSDNNRDVLAFGGTININTGSFITGRSFTVRDGVMNINGGNITFSTSGNFGSQPLSGSGTININGGNVTADRFSLKNGTVVTMGTGATGLLDFENWGSGLYSGSGDRAQDNGIDITFLAGSQVTLDLSSNARALDFTDDDTANPTTLPWGEALWNDGYLKYDNGGTIVSGADPDTLGWTIVSWADAINSAIGVGGGEYFEWAQAGSFGGTLSLSEVPEPSTFALMLGVVSLAVTTVRRRRK